MASIAIVCLGRFGNASEEVEAVIRDALDDTNEVIVQAGLRAVVHMGPAMQSLMSNVRKHIRSKKGWLAHAAQEALEAIIGDDEPATLPLTAEVA